MFGFLSPRMLAHAQVASIVGIFWQSPSPVYASWPVTFIAKVQGLQPTGTITWSTNSTTGSFSPTTTNLSNGVPTTSFTDSIPETVTITVSYSGDSNNLPSSDCFELAVLPLPVPMPLSVVLSGIENTSEIPTQTVGSSFSVDVRTDDLTGIKPGV